MARRRWRAWTVFDRTNASMTCRVRLFTAPLELTRYVHTPEGQLSWHIADGT